MNRETIEKAARDYIQPKASIIPVMESITKKEGFIAGADWRINSVWHTSIKEVKTCRAILVRFNNGLFNVFEDIRDLKGIEDLVAMLAYLDDLIPDRKEETV